ncbi:MAG: M20 family metallopeptidase [Deltaproteobacteria bacterium]|nr:M20 family metallopeptidase [Deltaproteobacteria bacterium]
MLDVVELTRALIRCNTVNPPGNEEACARLVARELEDAGFATSAHESGAGRPTIVASLAGARDVPALCLTGHLDTVPIGNETWEWDPFGGDLASGRVHGRGASDMKGGVAALVLAARCLARLPQRPPLVLALTAGEETGCEGAFHLVRTTRALEGVGAILVAEPTANYPLLGHRGALWLEIRVPGQSAHGSTPERGISAIGRAARGVVQLEGLRLDERRDALLGTASLNVGTINGGTSPNIVADLVTLGLDVRTLPHQHSADLVRRLAGAFECEVEVRTLVDVPSVLTPPDDPWVRCVFDVMGPLLGERPRPRTASYFTDASALRQGAAAPAVILGPGDPDQAHRPNESCAIERLEQAVDAYVRIATAWASAPHARDGGLRTSAAC